MNTLPLASWQVNLFGPLEVRQGDHSVTKFQTRHAAVLLAYLANRAGNRVTREHLLDLLWPEIDLPSAQNRLRVTLTSIRKQIESLELKSPLVADRTYVSLKQETCEVDAVEFRALVESALSQVSAQKAAEQLIRADHLYRGLFCEGLEGDWIEDERRSLSQLQAAGQMRLSHILGRSGDLNGAAYHARRAVTAEPLSEPARRVLIRCLLSLGAGEAAELELQEFRQLLQREVGLEPSPETLKLFEVGSKPEPPSAPEAVLGLLPTFQGSFVEPFNQLFVLEELLCASRIVFLTGPGGIGKTRLASEFIRSREEAFGAILWFEAHPDEEPRHLLNLIAEQASPGHAGAPLARIKQMVEQAYASSKKGALLVIDAAEHLPETAPLEIVRLLQEVPSLGLLLTTRRRIKIGGSQEHPVKPLEIPDTGSQASLLVLMGNPSVSLFCNRAKEADPNFDLSLSDAQNVAEICAALDGVPLALELAASRVKAGSVASVAREILGEGTLSPAVTGLRQMDSILSWSIRSLAPLDQKCLAELSVFPTTWDVEAANSVLDVPSSHEVLERLVENSLLIKESFGSQTRYRLLSSVRALARRQLGPQELAAARTRHAAHFSHRALQISASSLNVGVTEQIRSVQDQENFRSALACLSANPQDLEEFAKVVVRLFWYWIFTSSSGEVSYWVSQGVARKLELSPLRQADMELCQGLMYCYQEDSQEALRHLDAAAELLTDCQDSRTLAQAEWANGFARYLSGRLLEAREYLNRALAYMARIDAVWWVGATYNLLGNVEFGLGNLESAEAYFESSIEKWTSVGERSLAYFSHLGFARIRLERGEVRPAEETYGRCLAYFASIQNKRGLPFSVEGLARVFAKSGREGPATRLMGAAQRLREAALLHLDSTDQALHDEAVEIASRKLGQAFEVEWSVGYGLSTELVCRYAESVLLA